MQLRLQCLRKKSNSIPRNGCIIHCHKQRSSSPAAQSCDLRWSVAAEVDMTVIQVAAIFTDRWACSRLDDSVRLQRQYSCRNSDQNHVLIMSSLHGSLRNNVAADHVTLAVRVAVTHEHDVTSMTDPAVRFRLTGGDTVTKQDPTILMRYVIKLSVMIWIFQPLGARESITSRLRWTDSFCPVLRFEIDYGEFANFAVVCHSKESTQIRIKQQM
jgi:hypothetical protein